ncbi:MAG: hypothetical protein AAF512_15825 [Pseudomonadota bacterium]
MSKMDIATKFFHACESLEGRAGCAQYVADDAGFNAQSEPIADVTTVLDYCDWMQGLGQGPLNGCNYDIVSASFDESTSTALFFAVFTGMHIGDGGPVAPTGQTTTSHYVYAVTVNDDNKVSQMVKIWNAPWALKELGWV